jgi:hypothetical protein
MGVRYKKITLKDIRCEDVEWILLPEWWVLTSRVINILVGLDYNVEAHAQTTFVYGRNGRVHIILQEM